MKINILLFARLAEEVGERELQIELPDGALANAVDNELVKKYPTYRNAARGCALAVNEKYIQPDKYTLQNGDTLAIIPPVSGG